MEAVNNPEHYGGKNNPYEAIKVVEAWGLDKDFYLGNVVKYISRAGKKNSDKELEDLEKAKWYLDRKIEKHKQNNIVVDNSEGEIFGVYYTPTNILDKVRKEQEKELISEKLEKALIKKQNISNEISNSIKVCFTLMKRDGGYNSEKKQLETLNNYNRKYKKYLKICDKIEEIKKENG